MSTFPPTAHARRGPHSRSLVPLATAVALTLTGMLALSNPADARLGLGGSYGSRGSRTYTMPMSTPTAPSMSPLSRSQTAAPFNSGFAGSRPGFFGGGGFGRGLIGGFLGAGLFGLLFGHGLFGGLGGGLSLIGLLLQIGLLFLVVRFVIGMFRRQQPAFGGGPAERSAYAGGPNPFQAAQAGVGSGPGSGFGGPARGVPITIAQEDYQTFEQRLIQSQIAYSSHDLGALRRLATPEMAGNFAEELAGNDRQGVVNTISDVRLLQGDLSEAWREGGAEYATVAMRFSLVDATVERNSGRVVAGDPTQPQQVTEVWTFSRAAGSGPSAWVLSAIQQT